MTDTIQDAPVLVMFDIYLPTVLSMDARLQVSRRTGSVSYRLATGERVHARRLVPSRPGDGER